MNNKVVISSGSMMCGDLIFDYDNSYLKFNERKVGVPFSKITGIELKKPGFMTGGMVRFIVDGKSYIAKEGSNIGTFYFNVEKKTFPQLDAEVKKLSEMLGVEIRNIFGFNAPTEVYKGQFEAEYEKVKKQEIRKRCNVCGKIFCFTADDYANSLNHLTNAAFSSIGAIANAAAGSAWASNELNKSADRQMNRFVDYNRCPACNSTDLTLLSEEEFDAIKNTQSQPAAQEPKKTLVEQMAEYKQLLDMGVITQEEFDAKKKQLLGL